MKKYKIEFTEQQLITVARGLEFYSRFCAGQWEIPDAMEWKEYENHGSKSEFWNLRNQVQDMMNTAKSMLLPEFGMHGSYGMGHDKLCEDAKIAYDIYRPIWKEFSKYSGISNVYSSPGLTYSQEGRITVKEIK